MLFRSLFYFDSFMRVCLCVLSSMQFCYLCRSMRSPVESENRKFPSPRGPLKWPLNSHTHFPPTCLPQCLETTNMFFISINLSFQEYNQTICNLLGGPRAAGLPETFGVSEVRVNLPITPRRALLRSHSSSPACAGTIPETR